MCNTDVQTKLKSSTSLKGLLNKITLNYNNKYILRVFVCVGMCAC